MKKIVALFVFAFVFSLLAFLSPAIAQVSPTTYGTLDNFDVVNDTGTETHGFEIELEGISSTDIPFTFGNPYERYGDPVFITTATGVIVRYAATYDPVGHTWSAGTPTASLFPPTDGHSCWSLGDPNYPGVGCDHFGVSLNASPTKTTYRWLVETPGSPGTLMAFGTNIPLPAPVWNVTPPAIPGVDQPVAEAVIAAQPSADPGLCGEAQWVKVYTTELPNALHADDLEHMVVDDQNVDLVPEPSEVEFEWMLLQSCPGGSGELRFGGAAAVGEGNEAVSRRFEFYAYTGQYDPDPEAIHEAFCDNPLAPDQQVPGRCGDPVDGVAGVGAYIGKQNAAVNLAGPLEVVAVNHPPLANPDSVATDEDTAVSFAPLVVTGNDTDTDGDAISFTGVQNPVHGVVSYDGSVITFTPELNFSGTAGFEYSISDGIHSSVGSVGVTINPVNDIPVADAGPDQPNVDFHSDVTLSGSGTDVDGDSLTYNWTLVAVPLHSKAALTGETSLGPVFTADKEGIYTASLVVNDGLADSTPSTVTVTVVKIKKK